MHIRDFTMEEIPSSPSLLFLRGFSRFCRILLCLASCKAENKQNISLSFREHIHLCTNILTGFISKAHLGTNSLGQYLKIQFNERRRKRRKSEMWLGKSHTAVFSAGQSPSQHNSMRTFRTCNHLLRRSDRKMISSLCKTLDWKATTLKAREDKTVRLGQFHFLPRLAQVSQSGKLQYSLVSQSHYTVKW